MLRGSPHTSTSALAIAARIIFLVACRDVETRQSLSWLTVDKNVDRQ